MATTEIPELAVCPAPGKPSSLPSAHPVILLFSERSKDRPLLQIHACDDGSACLNGRYRGGELRQGRNDHVGRGWCKRHDDGLLVAIGRHVTHVQFGPKAEPIAQEILSAKGRPNEVSGLLPCRVCGRRGRRGRAGDAGEFGRCTRIAESGAIVQSDLLARLSEEYAGADGGHRGDLLRCGARNNWHGDAYREGWRS